MMDRNPTALKLGKLVCRALGRHDPRGIKGWRTCIRCFATERSSDERSSAERSSDSVRIVGTDRGASPARPPMTNKMLDWDWEEKVGAMTNTREGFARGLHGVPELDYEVTIEVKNKRTGQKNRMFYPNVGRVATDHQLTRECAGLEHLATEGMPQTLFLMASYNASPRSGKTVEVRDGGAMGKKVEDNNG